MYRIDNQVFLGNAERIWCVLEKVDNVNGSPKVERKSENQFGQLKDVRTRIYPTRMWHIRQTVKNHSQK